MITSSFFQPQHYFCLSFLVQHATVAFSTYNDSVAGSEAVGVVAALPARVDPRAREHGHAEPRRVPVLVARGGRRDEVRHLARHVFADRAAHVVDQRYQVRLRENKS